MSSRQEEKQRRREEREAAQRAAQASTARRRQLQKLAGVLLALAAIAAIVIAVTAGSGSAGHRSTTANTAGVKLAPLAQPDLTKAAAAAGCTVQHPPIEGRTHVTTTVTYRTNPPTSGNHNPVPALDGIYDAGNTPPKENFVHTLEHGRVEIQYRPGTPRATVKQLEALFNESPNGHGPGYKTLLFQNNTNMPYAVAEVAWGQLLGCPTLTAASFDALRDFRSTYLDKAPEAAIPPN